VQLLHMFFDSCSNVLLRQRNIPLFQKYRLPPDMCAHVPGQAFRRTERTDRELRGRLGSCGLKRTRSPVSGLTGRIPKTTPERQAERRFLFQSCGLYAGRIRYVVVCGAASRTASGFALFDMQGAVSQTRAVSRPTGSTMKFSGGICGSCAAAISLCASTDRDEHSLGRQEREKPVDCLLDEGRRSRRGMKGLGTRVRAQRPGAFTPSARHIEIRYTVDMKHAFVN